MKNGKMGFAVVGCGNIGPEHAAGIQANSDIAEISAFVDTDRAKAAKLAEIYKVKNVYSDLKEMLSNKDIDVVTIGVPSGLHMDIAIESAKAGKHVLCEKPLDVNLKKCDEMIKAVRTTGTKLGVVFQRRTFAESQKMKEVIESGRLGKMILGDAYLKYYRGPEYYASAGWRATWELDGGGALMNQGIHGIDLINWMMGGINSVYARCWTGAHKIIVEDSAVVMARYKNGASGVIEGTTSVYPGLPTRFEAHGSNGTVVLEDKGYAVWDIKEERDKPALLAKKEGPSGHAVLVKDLVDAIKSGKEPMINGEEARKSVEVVLAIYESSKTGKEVRVG